MNRLGKKANETLIEMALSADGRRRAGTGGIATCSALTLRGTAALPAQRCLGAAWKRRGWAAAEASVVWGVWGALVPPQGLQAGGCEKGLIPAES